ncbi:MAG: hypothetical protein GKR90_05110 [Pseudomonadales bacterium]|nr:hypothetical protein [Pseudomonadales bacterium]
MMDEILVQILRIAKKAWLYRRVAATSAFVLSICGWSILYVLPDVFRAETKVYVDTSTMLGRSLKGLAVEAEDSEGEFLDLARSLLLSEPNLERVARELDLDVMTSDSSLANAISQIRNVEVLGESTSTNRRSTQNMITIGFEHKNPALAYGVVVALLDIFLETMMGSSLQDAESTEKFLEETLLDYRRKLEAAEASLTAFKRKNMGLLPDSGGDYFSELRNLQTEIRSAMLDLDQAENHRIALLKQIHELSRSDNFQSELGPTDSKLRLLDLETRLVDLKLKYTDVHPEVMAIKRTIKDIKAGFDVPRSDEELVNAAAVSGNRVLEELRISLGIIDAQVAADTARIASDKNRLEELETAIDVIPRIEADFVKLTRDYDITKEQYDELLTRLEATRLSRERDKSEGDVVFRVIEPPKLPTRAIGPQRFELASLVLLVGILGGIGLGYTSSLLRPVFTDRIEMSLALKLPILGTISPIDAGVVTRKSSAIYITATFLLLFLYGCYVVLVLSTHP